MGTYLDKLPHQCGSRAGLQVFEREDGGTDGFCFSCNTYIRHPYGDERLMEDMPDVKFGKTKEEIHAEIMGIADYPVVDLPDRRLRAASLGHYSIRIGVDEADGTTPRLHYYPYTIDGKICGYKVRLIEGKRIWSIGEMRDVDLFGWEQAKATGARRLIITEGELDCVSLYRMLEMNTKKEYADGIPAIVSLPHGASAAGKDLARLSSKIRKHFQEVSFCFDDDEAGKLATIEASKVFPDATVIALPCKDANDCIIKGRGKAVHAAVTFRAEKPKNTRLVWLDDVWEAAKEPAKHGVSWPWEGVTRLTRGIRKGETIYIGAAPKMGKSEIVNAIASHLVGVHDWKVLLAKPEEANKKTVKLLAGKIASTRFHDPDVDFDMNAYEAAGEMLLGQRVAMLNLYQHLGWESLRQDIIAGAALGIDAVFIDPITNLTNGISAGDANTKLQEIAQELAAMALDLNISIFIFCHLRNPDGGLSHDRGGAVLTGQFAGSRAMGRSCNYMFGLEGNKDPDIDEHERNVRHLVLLDDREFGEVGRTSLFWDKTSTQFNEMK